MIILLLELAYPLAWGYLGVDFIKLMFHFLQKAYVLSLINYDPLSQIILDGTPNLHKVFLCMNKMTSLDVTCLNASASIHFEK